MYDEWTTILFFSSGLCCTCAWRRHIIQKSKIKNYSIYSLLEVKLESTDAAPEVPHPCSMRPNAGCGVRCGYLNVGPRLRFFFFFSWIRVNSAQFAPTRLNLCRIGFDLRRTGLIRPKSGRIGHIGADTIETGRKWLKHAENGRNLLWIWLEKPKLAFFFLFFVNQGIVMCFLRIF